MNLYAESSAVLSWLLEETSGGEVGSILSGAKRVFTSSLTLLECDRVIFRAVAAGSFTAEIAEERHRMLSLASRHWVIMKIAEEVIARARRRFPVEPIRSLDAIHVATALAIRDRSPGVSVASLDTRVRDNAAALGLPVLP